MKAGGVRSAALRHAPFVLFVAGILAYGAGFAWHLLDNFDLVNLIRDVSRDDAFYYFQIAYRMAGGEFSTYDGLTRTNGYHPLWLFLITPFYWVFDKTEALFAIKAFEIMLVAGGVALVAGAARVARQPWVLLFAALPALYRNPALFLGMEAAAALFLLGLFLLAVCLYARDPAGWRWPLAAVAFALPWVRLEYVAISLAATAALCLVERSGGFPAVPARRARRRATWRSRCGSARRPTNPAGVRAVLRRRLPARQSSPAGSARRSAFALNTAAPLAGAVAGILVYFTYNAVVFGGIVPVSGATKQWNSQRFWDRDGGYSLAGNFQAFLQTGFFDDEVLVALEVCVYVGLVWWFFRRSRGREDWLLLAFLVGVFGLAAGHLAKFAQSVLTVRPQEGDYDWYFVPAYLMGVLVVPARCYVAAWFVRRLIGLARRASRYGSARRPTNPSGVRAVLRRRLPGRLRRASSLAIVAAGAVLLFTTVDFAAAFRLPSRASRPTSPEWWGHTYMNTKVLNHLLPKDGVVGSGSSGVMGYFSRFPVMNMDGLANSWDYLRIRKGGLRPALVGAGSAPSQVREWDAFRRRYGIIHYVRPSEEGPELHQIWLREWVRGSHGPGIDPAAWFRERMEPHLERQDDGVGLLVDGRLVQAFAWENCAPGELAVWTWGPAGRDEPVIAPWTQTAVGVCASVVVRPRDAHPPARVAAMTADEYLAERIGERPPAIDADFDVYLVDDSLVYVKEQCGPDDVDTSFFLHVDPVVLRDLSVPRRLHGFDNLDFRFDGRGARFEGTCLAEVPLPKYDVAVIRTGQFVAVEGGFNRTWEGEIRLGTGR